MSRPLWIPLKSEYFLAFERGQKTVEYRLYGKQWSERSIFPGRPAILGHGYSGRRLAAVVERFETRVMDSDTYGKSKRLALIHLRVTGPIADAASPRTGSLFPT